MFHSARLKLTAWYLLIIMFVSILFSVAFYDASTREIQHIIDRIEFEEKMRRDSPNVLFFRSFPSIEDLKELKNRTLKRLILVNACILVFAGAAGYFLAGRTLKPIQQMVNEQTEFISDASHELRTPLATLRAEMEASLLEKKLSDTAARKLIKSNLEEINTLQQLTNNLLQLAQVHTVSESQLMEPVNVHDVLKTAYKKVNALAKKKQIEVVLSSVDATVYGNASSLIEMFVILLENAIKYSSDKSSIVVTMQKRNSSLLIAVTDQGDGISAEDLPYIFNRFYRADKSRSQTEGYGLGLSIAKQIVEAHEGEITVNSTVNKGTTFKVKLPIKTD